jgi:predicted 3-demethylubiquinone-9 3-methyltransferase (glyoxalase superfamily)
MNNNIYPCLALKGKINEAADFYINTFGEGKIVQTNKYVNYIELSGQTFLLLNEGPASSPNAAISFMVASESAEVTAQYWDKLTDSGKVMMPLDTYPWSVQYGWVEDKYGVSWQLFTGSRDENPQKFSPSLMFTGDNAGKAREAIHFYTALFPQSGIAGIMEYEEGEGDTPGLIKHAQFKLKDTYLTAMDSSANHGFQFNDAISIVVNCETQAEIDQYWEALTSKGGMEIACGWLVDPYGVSWQIVPARLAELVSEPGREEPVMNALMKMKKLIIADLENA